MNKRLQDYTADDVRREILSGVNHSLSSKADAWFGHDGMPCTRAEVESTTDRTILAFFDEWWHEEHEE